MHRNDDKRVIIGRVVALHGVRGWVRIFSYTEPREQIFKYKPWQLHRAESWHDMPVLSSSGSGKTLIARLQGIESRDEAAGWVGADIAVPRAVLPDPQDGSWYWVDLIGLEVLTDEGVSLGTVHHLLATGANDVLVVRGDRERLIPLVPEQVVKEVDIEAGRIRVDWDPDF